MSRFYGQNSYGGVPAYYVLELKPRLFKYALLIPVINEGLRIRDQLEEISKLNIQVDVVITDGGSNDGSLSTDFLESIGVSAVITKNSPGFLSTQLRAGFHFCLSRGYSGVITVDGNNKDDVECISLFVDKLNSGFDFIQGSRFIEGGISENTPLSRSLGIQLIHAPLTSIGANFRFTDSTNGFRGHSRSFLKDARVGIFREVFQTYELLAYLPIRAGRLKLRIVEVPVARRYPGNAPTPTKIKGFRSYSHLLSILFKAVFQRFNP